MAGLFRFRYTMPHLRFPQLGKIAGSLEEGKEAEAASP